MSGPDRPDGERDAVAPVAPVWRRFVAQLLDSLVLVGPVFVVLVVVGVDVDLEAGRIESDDRLLVAVGMILVVVVGYHTVLVARRGATIGKAAMGLRVVRVDEGTIPVWDRALLRALVPQGAGTLPGIGFALLTAVYGAGLFDRRRRGIHDLAAGTMVTLESWGADHPPAPEGRPRT